jgi:DNA-binding PadR family transcriptional regulator
VSQPAGASAPAAGGWGGLTAFQRDQLWALAAVGPAPGARVRERLEAAYDEPVNHGRHYPNLDRLVGQGLVEKQRQHPNRRANRYRLTEQGRRVLSERQQFIADCADGEAP